MDDELFSKAITAVKMLYDEEAFENVFLVGSAAANLHIKKRHGIYGIISDIDLVINDRSMSVEKIFSRINQKMGGRCSYIIEKNSLDASNQFYAKKGYYNSIFQIYYDDICIFDVFLNDTDDEEFVLCDGVPCLTLKRLIDEITETIPMIKGDIDYCKSKKRYKDVDYYEGKLNRYEERLKLLVA